jgi:hypothetical protein
MKPEDYLRNCRVCVWKGSFAVVKSKRTLSNAFAVIRDKNEITCIVEQSGVSDDDVIEIEKDWKILTFDTVLPFELVGFLAEVAKALADEKIGILAVSGYSTDHILVRKKDLDKAIRKLEELGCVVEKHPDNI